MTELKIEFKEKNIFNKDFNYMGVGAGPHKIYGICVVVGYAKNIRKIGSEPENITEWINKYYGEEKREEEIANFHISNNAEIGVNNSVIYNTNLNANIVINEYKFIEPDAPDNSISLNVTKSTKIINGVEKKYTKKTFLLKNGTNHIIEIEED